MDDMADSVDAYVPLLIWAAAQGPERVRQVAAGLYSLGKSDGFAEAAHDLSGLVTPVTGPDPRD